VLWRLYRHAGQQRWCCGAERNCRRRWRCKVALSRLLTRSAGAQRRQAGVSAVLDSGHPHLAAPPHTPLAFSLRAGSARLHSSRGLRSHHHEGARSGPPRRASRSWVPRVPCCSYLTSPVSAGRSDRGDDGDGASSSCGDRSCRRSLCEEVALNGGGRWPLLHLVALLIRAAPAPC
jgi:hypothetical protein